MGRIDKVISTPATAKSIVKKEKKARGYALYEAQGERAQQEDAAVACWYSEDTFAALSAAEIGYRLWTSYQQLNASGRKAMGTTGTTASTTVYDGKSQVITATLADTVAFAVFYSVSGALIGVARLNEMIHHPLNELERIKRVGGFISKDGRIQGVLALSRAIGDFSFAADGVCADASIDVHHIADLCHELDILPAHVGKIQLITTCDGFTEPLAEQTEMSHALWLFSCLSDILSLGNRSELEIAKQLTDKALRAGSEDNVSIAIQTLSYAQPCLIGIYDGHGGIGASTYVAKHIAAVFEAQCLLTPDQYAAQDLSVDKNFLIYCRDNEDDALYLKLAQTESKLRNESLSQPDGIWDQIEGLRKKADELQQRSSTKKDKWSKAEHAARQIYDFMSFLCTKYTDLTLNKNEFIECVKIVLSAEITPKLKQEKYEFLALDFAQMRNNVSLLKEHRGFKQLIVNLMLACVTLFIGYAVGAAITGRMVLFKPATNAGSKIDALYAEIDGLIPPI